MFDSLLTVCDGNICRSPTAAYMLARDTTKRVDSAGLVGLDGHDMDEMARSVAEAHGLECPTHIARKLTASMCRDYDLILVMEQRQKDRIMTQMPEASGKVMLLGHWLDRDIPDPYRKSREVYEQTYDLIEKAVASWQGKL